MNIKGPGEVGAYVGELIAQHSCQEWVVGNLDALIYMACNSMLIYLPFPYRNRLILETQKQNGSINV